MTTQAIAAMTEQRTLLPRNLATLCLLVVCLCAIVNEVSTVPWVSPLAAVSLLLFVTLQWSRINRTYQFFALLAGGLGITLWFSHKVTLEELAAAVDRGAFFTFFLTSLAVLREAARTSPLVRRCGTVLVNQPPGRRYLLMSFGSHLFSVMLNVGALNVLGTMVKRAIRPGRNAEERRIAGIRSRRMLTAVLRGFSGIPLWSPTSVTMLLVLSGIPDLTWEQYAPWGLLWCGLFILWGALLDRFSYPRRQTSRAGSGQLGYLVPLVLLVALIPSSAYLLSAVSGLRLFSALLICAPIIGLVWITFQYKRASPRLKAALLVRRAIRSFPRTFTDQRNEVVLFASSGFIGVILVPLLDPALITGWLQQMNISGAWLMIMISWVLLLFAFAGVNAIITGTLILGVLQQMPELGVSPVTQASVIAITWAVFSGGSPFTASLRFIAPFSNVPPLVFGVVWNGFFNVTVLLALHITLLILF